MADLLDVTPRKRTRILVFLHAACTIHKKRILELLQETDVDDSTITFVIPEDVHLCGDLDNTCVVIPIDSAISDSAELNDVGRHCGQAGAQVIVLFDDAFSYDKLHPIAEKYGTQCGWSVDQLRPWLTGGAPVEPRGGTGAPVVRPSARQVKCKGN